MSVGTKTLRLFFALWPDAAVRGSLAQFIETLKQTATARWVEPENLHITLAFLGEVNEDQLPLIDRIGGGINGQSFELALDRIEFWPKREIVWLSPSSTPPALENLANGLTAGVRQAGLAMENRPYRAHLTLARKAHPSRISSRVLDNPIRWNVESFCLIESHLSRMGSRYRVRKSWNLSGFQAIPDDLSVR
jgi:2'-5' RNA ligase